MRMDLSPEQKNTLKELFQSKKDIEARREQLGKDQQAFDEKLWTTLDIPKGSQLNYDDLLISLLEG